ncbi:MAG: hypothetical protein IH944_03060 [Armatimonadetes bacterium]|nr:hypothetical protein [Armatimonadota bacterium]
MISTLLLAISFVPSSGSSDLLDHAFAQWKATPEMRIEDAYKWLFHATLGGEHAVQDVNSPRNWMDSEWASLELSEQDEPEVVKLTPDGSVLRVNLRPYKDRGGNKEMLLWAFVFSAERFKANKSVFRNAWNNLGDRLSVASQGHVTRKEWQRLDEETHALGYPAIHHSRQYEQKYKPAYRVVLGEIWSAGI